MNTIEQQHSDMVERLLKPGSDIKRSVQYSEFTPLFLIMRMSAEVGLIADEFTPDGIEVLERYTDVDWNDLHVTMGLVGEVGEKVDAIKKLFIYRKADDEAKAAPLIENIHEELGDLAFYLCDFEKNNPGYGRELLKLAKELATYFDISWEWVLKGNIIKLTDPEKGRYRAGAYSDAAAQERHDKTIPSPSLAQETASLAPHQQRVVDEARELDERSAKLEAFFVTPIFQSLPKDEQDRMARQFDAMALYSSILKERIANF